MPDICPDIAEDYCHLMHSLICLYDHTLFDTPESLIQQMEWVLLMLCLTSVLSYYGWKYEEIIITATMDCLTYNGRLYKQQRNVSFGSEKVINYTNIRSISSFLC